MSFFARILNFVSAVQLVVRGTVTATEEVEVERKPQKRGVHTPFASKLPAQSSKPLTPFLPGCLCSQLRLGGQQALTP